MASVTGLVISVACLVVFGTDRFVVPAMFFMLLYFMAMRSKLEVKEEKK